VTIWICIPVFNRLQLTIRCLDSLRRQTYSDYQIIVCDDGSTDGTGEHIETHYPEVKLLKGDGNLWWTGATNRCIEYALKNCGEQDFILTLNNDLEVEENYLTLLSKVAQRYPDALIGSASHDIATGQLMDSGGRHSWITAKATPLDPKNDTLPDDPDVGEVTHLPGRGTLIPIKVLRHIGLFDFRRLPHYGADYDLAFRASRAGYRVLISYKAQVLSHIEETGLTKIRDTFKFSKFIDYLSSRRSPGNLRVRFWVAINNCPPLLIPSFLLIDTVRVIGSYIKHHLKRSDLFTKAEG
jgi:GT2 family glycosyltransferase